MLSGAGGLKMSSQIPGKMLTRFLRQSGMIVIIERTMKGETS